VTKENFDSKNLKIVLTIKSYTPEEKVDLIIKNAKALKEKVVKALETRFKPSLGEATQATQ
jgi:NACalpha-BTF3-like transcription factor